MLRSNLGLLPHRALGVWADRDTLRRNALRKADLLIDILTDFRAAVAEAYASRRH
jgi:hypothetical protein